MARRGSRPLRLPRRPDRGPRGHSSGDAPTPRTNVAGRPDRILSRRAPRQGLRHCPRYATGTNPTRRPTPPDIPRLSLSHTRRLSLSKPRPRRLSTSKPRPRRLSLPHTRRLSLSKPRPRRLSLSHTRRLSLAKPRPRRLSLPHTRRLSLSKPRPRRLSLPHTRRLSLSKPRDATRISRPGEGGVVVCERLQRARVRQFPCCGSVVSTSSTDGLWAQPAEWGRCFDKPVLSHDEGRNRRLVGATDG